MNIVINAILMGENPRGVGVYINNLIKSLAEVDKKNNYYIYYGGWMKGFDFYNIKQNNFTFIKENISQNKVLRNLYQLIIFPLKTLKYSPDVIHIPDTSPVLIMGNKTISTIHDLAEFYYPEKYGKLQALIRKVIVNVQIKRSAKIITISEFSKQSIMSRFKCKNKKITVIYNGVDFKKATNVKQVSSEEVLNKYKLTKGRYFLFVSELERTKNASVIVECYNKYFKGTNYKIVLCGKKGNDYEYINTKIKEFGLENMVVYTGYVTDLELVTLYKNATTFIFPSLFEGFGLPIIEAMANGVPVICSNRSSLPEVGGGAVLKFDPNGIDELYECILKAQDESTRTKMIQLGFDRIKIFNWENTAKAVLDIYWEVYNNDKSKVN
ncbi:glycosyltransferase family 4 protein [Clostridium thermarum]|uniref:glycosyltransferase family 4 protein n=1 Tax=Clostridium thermarum TaxID=1716543 RepID=UPI001124CB00|nr:glycosyltransferase family 1 protein [Clostridium thermarum]